MLLGGATAGQEKQDKHTNYFGSWLEGPAETEDIMGNNKTYSFVEDTKTMRIGASMDRTDNVIIRFPNGYTAAFKSDTYNTFNVSDLCGSLSSDATEYAVVMVNIKDPGQKVLLSSSEAGLDVRLVDNVLGVLYNGRFVNYTVKDISGICVMC